MGLTSSPYIISYVYREVREPIVYEHAQYVIDDWRPVEITWPESHDHITSVGIGDGMLNGELAVEA